MTQLPLSRFYRPMFWVAILLLIVPGALRAYFLMPAPGSQETETIAFAYYIEKVLLPMRIIGILLLILPLLNTAFNGRLRSRIGKGLLLVFIGGLYVMTDRMMSAEVMFREPDRKFFADSAHSVVPLTDVVVGVTIDGLAKAYPIEYIGYHHKVQDTLAGKPMLVTYCTMCRTARVYNPMVNGVYQRFRLVGARHFNAVIEDESTGSWWYQATGEAAVGPDRGKVLESLPSRQMTLSSWIALHPTTLIMQPDTTYNRAYARLKGYDRRRPVEKNSAGVMPRWDDMSWVVGIEQGGASHVYEWSDLLEHRAINDTLGGIPLLVAVEKDSLSFHAFDRTVRGKALTFHIDPNDPLGRIADESSGSAWNWNGECVAGAYVGERLGPVQAVQEYWHSWRTFHPTTMKWE